MNSKSSVGLFFVLVLVSVFSDTWADEQDLLLTGSSTLAPLVLEIAKRYESMHQGIRIDVQMGGSSRGINDARMGLADIGMVSRALKTTEQDLIAHQIAMDGIGIILHKSNSVSSLSEQQIIDIYTGKIRNWKTVGGVDQSIIVLNKAEGRSTLELFLEYFKLKNSQIRADVVIGDNQQGIKTLASNSGAIAYVSIGTAEFEINQGRSIKLLPMAGKTASVESLAKGEHPLSRPLNLVVKSVPSVQVQNFLTFAKSKAVKDLVEAQFFVFPE